MTKKQKHHRRAYKLQELAAEQGVTVDELVTEAMKQHRTEMLAAVSLGVYPNTIRNYFKRLEEKSNQQ